MRIFDSAYRLFLFRKTWTHSYASQDIHNISFHVCTNNLIHVKCARWCTNFSHFLLSFFFILSFSLMYMYWCIEGQRVRRESFVPRCKWYFRKVISGRCAEQRRFCSQWCDFSEATRLCQISRFLRGERFTMYEAVEESIKRENSSKALLSRVRAISLSEYYNASCHSFREYFTTVFP